MPNISSLELIAQFQTALRDGWGYIYGASGEIWTQAQQNAASREQTKKYGQKWVGHRVADCSGLFAWAFRQLGGYCYHGSNTMFRRYSSASGSLSAGKRTDGEPLKPGTAVYKFNASEGYHHVGLYIGEGAVIQQGIAQKLQNIWESQFSDSSYGYRPKRSGQQAIQKVKEYAEAGYRYAVSVDLSKYFDTLNHELLMNLLHRKIQDMRILRIIKKYLKSGVMENGVICKTEEGSPQGGPLSPLLANIYLNEFDWEMHSRGVKTVRYADDIVVFAKSKRAAERLLESSRRYLEGKLKLKMNTENQADD